MFKTDRVIFSINYLQWNGLDPQITLKNINRSFNFVYFLDNPLGGSRFSAGVGFSFTALNLYSDAIPRYLIDSVSLNYIDFIKIKDVSPNNHNYKNNKMVFTYGAIPFELRLRPGKNELLKFAAGFEVGYLISSYLKYHGDNLFKDNSEDLKFKFFNIKNMMKLRYGVSFRMGYNRFSIRFFYPLTTVFEQGKGPAMYPLEIGLSLMVF